MKGDYNFEITQKRFDSSNNSNNFIMKEDSNLRPISAAIKRPDTFKFNKNAVKINKTEFPSLINHISSINQQSDNGKAKSISKNVEKERLYDDNINLKSLINNLKKEKTMLKSQINSLEMEMNRKDKAIEDINYDMQSSKLNSGNCDNYQYPKGKETSLIMNLKKQIKEVEREIKQKAIEHDQLKKNSKITKLNELEIDLSTQNDELIKVKKFYEISVKTNQEKERYLNDFILLKDVFIKQQNQLVTLNEKSRKLDEDVKIKENELEILKRIIKDKDSKIIALTKEFKEQLEFTEKIDKEISQIDATTYQNKLFSLEKKIENFKKEIHFFKTEANKKDKRYKELEKIAKSKIDFNSNYTTGNNFKDSIKFSDNQQGRLTISPDELKAKFQKLTKEKEDLELLNKKLTEKLNFHENQQDISNHMNSNQNNINNNEMKTNELVSNNNNIGPEEIKDLNYQENDKQDMNDVLDEEELKNYLFNEDQFKEFTYILIKNFEAQKLESNKLTKIFQEIDQNTDEIILSELASKIAEALGIKNQIDQTKILIYINTLLIYSGSDYDSFKQKFFTLFDSVSSFSQNQQEEYKNKLIKKLKKHIDKLDELINSFDQNNTGLITFQQLRKILDTININLNDELVEYLIYLMKCFTNDENSNLEDLRYSNILNLIPRSNDKNEEGNVSKRAGKVNITEGPKTKIIDMNEEEKEVINEFKIDSKNNKGSAASLMQENINNEMGLKQEDSEVVITTNQFNKILEGIFMKIAEHLMTYKKTARTHFKEIIYSHELNNEVYEAIPLQYLLDDLEKINLKIDTIGIHCLYEKLKYSDDYESIDVAKLVEELENYGIFENNYANQNALISNRKEENSEEIFCTIGNFLNEKKIKLTDLFKNKIGVSEEGEMIIYIEDFEAILFENSLIKNKNLSKIFLNEIILEEDILSVSIPKLKQKIDSLLKKNEYNKEVTKKNSGKVNIDNKSIEENLKLPIKTTDSKRTNKTQIKENKEISLSNDIPEADSKLFNETLNGLKEKEDDHKNQEDNSLLELEKELEEEDKKRESESK